MKAIEIMQEWLDSLENAIFYRYLAGILSVIIAIAGIIIYQYYTTMNEYTDQIEAINEQRQDVQELLEKAHLVYEQKKAVNALLAADPNFKIEAYFTKVISQLGLQSNLDVRNANRIERGDQKYDESILNAKLSGMNMKEVSELLENIEENKRVYIKNVEIEKSRKKPRTVEVHITIATLQPRSV